MPPYNNAVPPSSVYEGDSSVIVNAEQLGTNVFSLQVAIADKDGSLPRPVTVTFTYASAPSSVQYDIYVAWDDTRAAHQLHEGGQHHERQWGSGDAAKKRGWRRQLPLSVRARSGFARASTPQ